MTSAEDERLARRVAIYHQVCQEADRMEADVQISDDLARKDELEYLAEVAVCAVVNEADDIEETWLQVAGYVVAVLEAIEAGRAR